MKKLALTLVLSCWASISFANGTVMSNNNAPSCSSCHKSSPYTATNGKSGLTSFCLSKYPSQSGAYNSSTFVCTAPLPTSTPKPTTPPTSTPVPTTPPSGTPVPTTPPTVTPVPTTPPTSTPVPTATPKPLPNTKPQISLVSPEWDAIVGIPLSIPLSVLDNEDDAFTIIGTVPAGVTFSSVYTSEVNGLPTVDLEWTPTLNQANKRFNFTLKAKEIQTKQKLVSLPVKFKVAVWNNYEGEQGFVKKVLISQAKLSNTQVTLAGKVILSPLMTNQEKLDYLAQISEITINGVQYPISVNKKGQWTIAGLTLSECTATVEFDGIIATKTIKGCVKI